MNPNWQQGYQNPQQTGYQQPLYAQQTGYPGQLQQQQQPSFQQRPPPPPIPSQQGQPSYSFLNAPPPSSQFQQASPLQAQATGWAGAGQGMGSLQPQQTGWNAGGGGGMMAQQTGLMPQQTGYQGGGGMQPLMAQPTGFHDPRLQMMASSFMPMNTSSVSLARCPLPYDSISPLTRPLSIHRVALCLVGSARLPTTDAACEQSLRLDEHGTSFFLPASLPKLPADHRSPSSFR